ncbi:hypothetical protein BD311DRAFT_818249 [Dichomitus squalens]|uniref:C2H2-type domain-containing protein n=1 Tax=Dichomitus squalens TaxID=114155 RepID=A0A4Q9MB21_9APHY|nr:hypothetical protein BD311DRAFT_818249 [Dichomitus squalens]
MAPIRNHANGVSDGAYTRGLVFSDRGKAPSIRYWCSVCNESVARLSDFPRHMLKHSDTCKVFCKLSGCRQVGRGFKQAHNLVQHLKTAHGRDNKFKCPHVWVNRDATYEPCSVAYGDAASLRRHRSDVHGFEDGDDEADAQKPTYEGSELAKSKHNQRKSSGKRAVVEGTIIVLPPADPADRHADCKYIAWASASGHIDNAPSPMPCIAQLAKKTSSKGKPRQTARTSAPCPLADPDYSVSVHPTAAGSGVGSVTYGQLTGQAFVPHCSKDQDCAPSYGSSPNAPPAVHDVHHSPELVKPAAISWSFAHQPPHLDYPPTDGYIPPLDLSGAIIDPSAFEFPPLPPQNVLEQMQWANPALALFPELFGSPSGSSSASSMSSRASTASPDYGMPAGPPYWMPESSAGMSTEGFRW